MSESKEENPLVSFIHAYEGFLIESFRKLWNSISIEHDKLDAFSVIGGLISRQVTLSIELVRSPNAWNGHSAPLFLRAMTDLHISLAWILLDIEDRTAKYIMHGLGEEKLLVEQYKHEIKEHPDDELSTEMQQMVALKEKWISSQRHEFLVEVNLGHWAQLDYRKMAKEADCESLYNFAYKPFSVAAHNMWPHVSVYNSRVCENPLHRYHLIPDLFDFESDLDYVYRSCKYVHRTYEAVVERFDLKPEFKMPLQWWHEYFSAQDEGLPVEGEKA